jgi:hypothetical protein
LGRGDRIHLILHGHTPRLDYRGEKHVPVEWALASGRFRTKADFASRPAANVL